mmetsp:Transcript_40345/g.84730  ORF Transcript_40345/g.84730 Transcript_40345/m.84730 type:complete len:202 (+) Transcript_40345:804-1409(+)
MGTRQRRMLPRLSIGAGQRMPRRPLLPRLAQMHPGQGRSGHLQRLRTELGPRRQHLRHALLPGSRGRLSQGRELLRRRCRVRREITPVDRGGCGIGREELHPGRDRGIARRRNRQGTGRGGHERKAQLVVRHVLDEHVGNLQQAMSERRRLSRQCVGFGQVFQNYRRGRKLRYSGGARQGTGAPGQSLVRPHVERHARNLQ